MIKKFVALMFLLLSLSACSNEPKTYEECILQNMQGINSDTAAYAIKAVCKEKFVKPNPFDQFDNKN